MAWEKILSEQAVTSGSVTLSEMSKLGKYAFKEYEEPASYAGLTFTANTAGSTIKLLVTKAGVNLSYSLDSLTWDTYTSSTTITLANTGDKVYFKGNNPNGIGGNTANPTKFVMTGSIAASGNIMSLLDNGACTMTTIPEEYAFVYLFYECEALTTAPELPATTLSTGCYYSMFWNCTNLQTIPKLPATTLANACYYYMFCGCDSLQIHETSQSGVAEIAYTVPYSGTFTNTYEQLGMFVWCQGPYYSEGGDMPGVKGKSYTYYTQNTPV